VPLTRPHFVQLISFLVCIVLAVYLLVHLLNPWMHHVQTVAAWVDSSEVSPENSATLAATKIVTILSAESNRKIKAGMLSPLAVRNLSSASFSDEVDLLGNYSPPDLAEFIPVREEHNIFRAYGLLLQDLVVQVSARADVEDELKMALNLPLARNRGNARKSTKNSQSPVPTQTLTAIRKVLDSHLKDKTRVAELLQAYSEYTLTEELVEEDSQFATVVLAPAASDLSDLGLRDEKSGAFRVIGEGQSDDAALTIMATVLGPSYQFVPFKRSKWFSFDLVRGAKIESLPSAKLDSYYGPSGSLGRIPLGLLVARLDSVVIETDSWKDLRRLAQARQFISLDGNGLHLRLDARALGNTNDQRSVVFSLGRSASLEAIAVIFEKI